MDAEFLRMKHEAGMPYEDYVRSGTPRQHADWQAVWDAVSLTPSQRDLVASFTRRINVIALSGLWCGDCVQQGPLIGHIAAAAPERVVVRWLDRDRHEDLQARVSINAGHRVPVLLFCAQDHELVGWYGDRTLARYRMLARQALGAACPLPGAPVPTEEQSACLQDWLDEFERVHLLLSLSTRLQQAHQD